MAANSIANAVLADEGGVIHLTLWRQQAHVILPLLEAAMAAAEDEDQSATIQLTNLNLGEGRNAAATARVLNST